MSLTLEQYERIVPRCEIEHAGTRMAFVTPSMMTKYRVDSIYTKEPCTLDWIAGFAPGEIMVDVGANVGMYSIWAAATRGVNVFSFEPEAQNYALLNRNIQINKLQDKITAFCAGLMDRRSLTALHMADLRVGGSNHAVGEALNFKGDPLSAAFTQGCIALTLDELVATREIPMPHHIKIDVDGFEHKVIAGARAVLDNADRALAADRNQSRARRSPHDDRGIERSRLPDDPAQVAKATRPDGPFKGMAEHIFRR